MGLGAFGGLLINWQQHFTPKVSTKVFISGTDNSIPSESSNCLFAILFA
jgi:hypothetical protein